MNQRQYVGLEVLVLQCWSSDQCTRLRQEASNLHKVWLPVCRIWWIPLCPATCKLLRDNTCPTKSRRISLRFSSKRLVYSSARTYPVLHTMSWSFIVNVLQTRESRNGHSDFIPFSCDGTFLWFCGFCYVSAWDSGDTREDGRIWTRSLVRTRRNRNVRKLDQNKKITTTLRDDDTTCHGRAQGLTLEYVVVTGKGYWWVSWKTSFPNPLIDTDQKFRMSCEDWSCFRFRTVLS